LINIRNGQNLYIIILITKNIHWFKRHGYWIRPNRSGDI